MAIDSASKRFSMINFGDGTTIHLPFEPDGAVDLDDRQQLLDCYNGIGFAAPGGVVVELLSIGSNLTGGHNKHRGGMLT